MRQLVILLSLGLPCLGVHPHTFGHPHAPHGHGYPAPAYHRDQGFVPSQHHGPSSQSQQGFRPPQREQGYVPAYIQWNAGSPPPWQSPHPSNRGGYWSPHPPPGGYGAPPHGYAVQQLNLPNYIPVPPPQGSPPPGPPLTAPEYPVHHPHPPPIAVPHPGPPAELAPPGPPSNVAPHQRPSKPLPPVLSVAKPGFGSAKPGSISQGFAVRGSGVELPESHNINKPRPVPLGLGPGSGGPYGRGGYNYPGQVFAQHGQVLSHALQPNGPYDFKQHSGRPYGLLGADLLLLVVDPNAGPSVKVTPPSQSRQIVEPEEKERLKVKEDKEEKEVTKKPKPVDIKVNSNSSGVSVSFVRNTPKNQVAHELEDLDTQCNFDPTCWAFQPEAAIQNGVMYSRITGKSCEECLKACRENSEKRHEPYVCRAVTYDHNWKICDLFAITGGHAPYFLRRFSGRAYFRPVGNCTPYTPKILSSKPKKPAQVRQKPVSKPHPPPPQPAPAPPVVQEPEIPPLVHVPSPDAPFPPQPRIPRPPPPHQIIPPPPHAAPLPPHSPPFATHLPLPPTPHQVRSHHQLPPPQHQVPQPDHRHPQHHQAPQPDHRHPQHHQVPQPDHRHPPHHQVPQPDHRHPPHHQVPQPDHHHQQHHQLPQPGSAFFPNPQQIAQLPVGQQVVPPFPVTSFKLPPPEYEPAQVEPVLPEIPPVEPRTEEESRRIVEKLIEESYPPQPLPQEEPELPPESSLPLPQVVEETEELPPIPDDVDSAIDALLAGEDYNLDESVSEFAVNFERGLEGQGEQEATREQERSEVKKVVQTERQGPYDNEGMRVMEIVSADTMKFGECVAVRDVHGKRRCPHGVKRLIDGTMRYCKHPVDC